MRSFHKLLLYFLGVATLFIIFYTLQLSGLKQRSYSSSKTDRSLLEQQNISHNITYSDYINIWSIFTKVTSNSPLKFKFNNFLFSLLEHASRNISLHIITDNDSKIIATNIINDCKKSTGKAIKVTYHNVNQLAARLSDIVAAMQPHFSSQPGTYYSDALFFLSLGLHRIATDQSKAIVFDADTKLLGDVAELHQHFEKFGKEALFGLAPELTPVYRHVLYVYRSKHKNTAFGNPAAVGGFPGLNSGVLLMNLDGMRRSEKYHTLLRPATVDKLVSKYSFKGHLGDQDFYTLLAMEHQELLYVLPCQWNRQLCTWWRDHGYRDVFDQFFRCDGEVMLYHGNCNTPIPAN